MRHRMPTLSQDQQDLGRQHVHREESSFAVSSSGASGNIASPGVRGVDPWTALDSVWTSSVCVTIEPRGRERGKEEEKQGRGVRTNQGKREGGRQEEEGDGKHQQSVKKEQQKEEGKDSFHCFQLKE